MLLRKLLVFGWTTILLALPCQGSWAQVASPMQGAPPLPDAPTAQAPSPTAPVPDRFENPILRVGPDPWVVRWKGFYYVTFSTGNNIQLRKTADMGQLRFAQRRVIWRPSENMPSSSAQLWAPELHRLAGKWYMYFAADDGANATHRIFVLENDANDPIEGIWLLKSQVTPESYGWAIDPTVFELNGKSYLVWSGWPKDHNDIENLYIAQLETPWTVEGDRVLISKPDHGWEKHTEMPDWTIEVPHKGVNEAPEILQHNGQTFLVYSASGCWTDSYALGMLQLQPGGDPLDPKAWTKLPGPVFQTDPNAPAYSPGHNGFFTSPDGTQSWILYHANSAPGQGCGNSRSLRMQRFTWAPDGLPIFGAPVPLGTPLEEPAGAAGAAAPAP